MEYDVSLYAGNFAHLTERPLFEGLEALFTVLRDVPGPKAVVLITAGPGPSVLPNNLHFLRAAAMASDARVSLYPVDVMGLYARPPTCTSCGSPGGSSGFARLAVDTGGRNTIRTNDVSLGYARARRDLGCRYTL